MDASLYASTTLSVTRGSSGWHKGAQTDKVFDYAQTDKGGQRDKGALRLRSA